MKLNDWLLVLVGAAQAFAAFFIGGWMIAIYRRMQDLMDRQMQLMESQVRSNSAANRARISLHDLRWDYFTETPDPLSPIVNYHFIVQWKNSGQTPAVQSWNWMNGIVLHGSADAKLPPDFPFEHRQGQKMEAQLFQIVRDQVIDGGRHPVSAADLVEVFEQRATAYLWSAHEYNDVFDQNERRITTFCMRLVVPNDPRKVAPKESRQFLFQSTGLFTKAT